MSYMRFIALDEQMASQDMLQQAVNGLVPNGIIRPVTPGDFLEIEVGDELHAEVEMNLPGDEMFKEEIDELREPVEWYSDTPEKARVLATLDGARWMLCFRLTETGWNDGVVDELCDWLMLNFNGLLQIDGAGYFDAEDVVLEM